MVLAESAAPEAREPAVDETAGFVMPFTKVRESSARRLGRVVLLVASLAVTALAVVVLVSGARVFVVESPSMGRAAPVGTLVVDLPVEVSDLTPGDVVSYRPPDGSGVTYTHRVTRVEPGGIRTRGDINGADDPWLTPQSAVVGRSAALIPGVGWIARGAPFIAAGVTLLWMLTFFIRSGTWRSGLRVLGVAAVVSGTCALLKPLCDYLVLSREAVDGGERITAVSTGLLPIHLQATGGGGIDLQSGAVGTLFLPAGDQGRIGLQSVLALDPIGWAGIGVLCLLPLLWVLVVGLPAEEDPGPDDAGG